MGAPGVGEPGALGTVASLHVSGLDINTLKPILFSSFQEGNFQDSESSYL